MKCMSGTLEQIMKFAYIITLNNQGAHYTYSGEITVEKGATRLDAYNKIMGLACDHFGLPKALSSVIFFWLEPLAINTIDIGEIVG